MSRICCMVFVSVLMIEPGLVWAKAPTPTIIPADGGEHPVRRWGYPLTIKVDPVTTGAHSFSIGTEIILPGKEIPPHRHRHTEEVVVVQDGIVEAVVGNKSRNLTAGGMAYAPPDTWMSFKNHSKRPDTVLWIFPQPGFEQYVRATSVKLGQPVKPLSADELSVIRNKYAEHIELEAPATSAYPSDAK